METPYGPYCAKDRIPPNSSPNGYGFRRMGLPSDNIMPVWHLRNVLLAADQLCLSRTQIHVILSIVHPDDNGDVEFGYFLRVCCLVCHGYIYIYRDMIFLTQSQSLIWFFGDARCCGSDLGILDILVHLDMGAGTNTMTWTGCEVSLDGERGQFSGWNRRSFGGKLPSPPILGPGLQNFQTS